jgi:hypothetical protein
MFSKVNKPGDHLKQAPPSVAPHMPRLDGGEPIVLTRAVRLRYYFSTPQEKASGASCSKLITSDDILTPIVLVHVKLLRSNKIGDRTKGVNIAAKLLSRNITTSVP